MLAKIPCIVPCCEFLPYEGHYCETHWKQIPEELRKNVVRLDAERAHLLGKILTLFVTDMIKKGKNPVPQQPVKTPNSSRIHLRERNATEHKQAVLEKKKKEAARAKKRTTRTT